MEGEEQINEEEQPVKMKPKRVKLTVEKVKEISSRMLAPVVEEQKEIDVKRVIRAIKDPDSVVKGTKQPIIEFEEEDIPRGKSKRKSHLDKANRESLHSLYKLPGTDIKIGSMQPESIGFLECMSAPRFPHFDETESDTTYDMLSNDDESNGSQSILELLNSDLEDDGDTTDQKSAGGCKKVMVDIDDEEENNDGKKPARKPKLKRWKPKIQQHPIAPDPLITELTDGVTKYLGEIGMFNFMKDWLCHLYGMNPRPKDPVKLLRKYLEDSLGNSDQGTSGTQLEKELRATLRKEDDIMVEISKLKHLAHLLAPEIYDADGNMIIYEPSLEEEQFLIEEETAEMEDIDKVIEQVPLGKQARKPSVKSRSAVKKTKTKQSTADISRMPSKTKGKLKKKKSVPKFKSVK